MQNEQENSELSRKDAGKLVVVSIGRHTRLGDVLEYALAGHAFETVDEERFFNCGFLRRLVDYLPAGVILSKRVVIRNSETMGRLQWRSRMRPG